MGPTGTYTAQVLPSKPELTHGVSKNWATSEQGEYILEKLGKFLLNDNV